MTERRKENMWKSVVLPVVVAVITGVGSSYVAISVTLAILETRLQYVEDDLISIKDVLVEVNKNQIELARRGEWMVNMDKRTDTIERAIEILAEQSKDRYTRTEAEKDLERVYYKIEAITK